jgi:hypothetical protein
MTKSEQQIAFFVTLFQPLLDKLRSTGIRKAGPVNGIPKRENHSLSTMPLAATFEHTILYPFFCPIFLLLTLVLLIDESRVTPWWLRTSIIHGAM